MSKEKKRQTRRHFLQAFWGLYQKQPVHTITIGVLCRSAGYSRTTFYEYFQDIYDVLEIFEDNVIEQFLRELDQYVVFEKKIDELERMIVQGFPKAYLAWAPVLDVLLGEKGDPAFLHRMYRRLFERFEKVLAGHDPSCEHLMKYSFYALFGMLSAWNRDGRPIPLESLMDPVLAAVNQGNAIILKTVTPDGHPNAASQAATRRSPESDPHTSNPNP